ncbi:MAG TPA: RNA methyltransferase substrate-binding domain-containing protein, partial [Gaiellaceae bacterium]|nr:RNA methyltransferase substrate-binding domain-containing protein [Gaiellaceae bacterium]
MIVYGRNPVREALRGRRQVRRVWATASAAREEWLAGVEVERADDDELERLCGSPDHQGICADAGDYPYADADGLLGDEEALVVCLDQIQDPRNLG